MEFSVFLPLSSGRAPFTATFFQNVCVFQNHSLTCNTFLYSIYWSCCIPIAPAILLSIHLIGNIRGGEGMSSTTTQPDSIHLLNLLYCFSGIFQSSPKDDYIP